jgi:hypothetical protein
MTLSSLFAKDASKTVKALRYSAYTALALYGASLAFDYATETEYTDAQKETLSTVFQDSLDVGAISFRKSKLTDYMIESIGSEAFALGNAMHMHTRYEENDPLNITPWHFIHENAHIWQHQHCDTQAPTLLYALTHDMLNAHFGEDNPDERQHVPYSYRLTEDRDLSDYNREQQASLIADYFRILDGGYPIYLDINQNYKRDMHLYESTLKNFLDNPSYIQTKCENILGFNPEAGL